MSALTIERPAVDEQAAASEGLKNYLTQHGAVDLRDALKALGPVPTHLLARALNDLLAAGVVELTAEQQLRLAAR
ncbi:MAG: hypothetical protein ACXVX8_02125 [Blastococcus sp.]